MRVKVLVTVLGVVVDSVPGCVWESNKGGIHEITRGDHGVRINWIGGSTFVPYANVRYTQEV